MSRLFVVLFSLEMLAATDCRHLGPETVAADSFDHNATIAASGKHQTFLNIPGS
jgi:hypothetical protein